jgi:sirohydrochlorin ferrochelatase
MIIALIDNGSLEPAAQRNLAAVATALSARTAVTVHPVSWKHSDRNSDAWTLAPFVRAQVRRGEREFVFVPFFISAQGAIGSALRGDLEKLQRELGGFDFTFTDGLATRGAIPTIVADRIRAIITEHGLTQPPVVVVDHGGPSATSAALRDQLAAEVRTLLGGEITVLAAASMEGTHRPLLAEQLRSSGFAGNTVVVAPLFLSPGRHAGPGGDLARICAASDAQCHIADLVGTHVFVADALAAALQDTLSTLHVQPSA